LSESTSYFERFRRQMEVMDFETLPLFGRPLFGWSLRTDYVGRRLIYRPKTESTMDDARRMLERFRLTDGAILLAEGQSAGRGRDGRAWISPPDVTLPFTLVLRLPLESMRHIAYVTPLAVALALEDAASMRGIPLHVDLKWPNDVQIDGRKVAGILIETAEDEAGGTAALIGVGINVNLDVAAYPEIADIATSLRDALGVEVPREEVLAGFCNHFEVLHEQALAGDDAPFQAWRQRLITLGRDVVATGSKETIRGRAVEVERDGTLVIETADGRRVSVVAGDVTLSARDEG
jgi:BirA family biotin operon repressor/biotin-[acetyl-CoA-carboxylase] ligase